MSARFSILFFLFTLLLLFYPGNNPYISLFAYHPELFQKKSRVAKPTINPLAYVIDPVAPLVTAEGVYIVDLPSFSPLYEKNLHQPFFPASTAKIITALVAIDHYRPDDVITVKRVLTEGQVMGLNINEKITLENLLYGILVHSGNDAAYAVADAVGFDRFVSLMNRKAQELRMVNTRFTNPAGLDDINQYTTPFDLALASRALLNNRVLKKTVATKEIIISDVDFKYFHKLTNVNQLLGEIAGVGGLKTGYTENAGENLVSFYQKDGHQSIIVIMRSSDRFADTRTIIDWIGTHVEYKDHATAQKITL